MPVRRNTVGQESGLYASAHSRLGPSGNPFGVRKPWDVKRHGKQQTLCYIPLQLVNAKGNLLTP